MSRDEVIQEVYEEKLCSYWRKLLHIKELEEKNTYSQLRLKSIADRNRELNIITNQLNVLEQLSGEILVIPNWYKDILSKHDLVDKRLNI